MDIELTTPTLFFLVLTALAAGIASSGLGLGAGTVLNPVLINYLDRYPPSVIIIVIKVISASSVFLMFLISSFGTAVFISKVPIYLFLRGN